MKADLNDTELKGMAAAVALANMMSGYEAGLMGADNGKDKPIVKTRVDPKTGKHYVTYFLHDGKELSPEDLTEVNKMIMKFIPEYENELKAMLAK